jgi:hypothetical protein
MQMRPRLKRRYPRLRLWRLRPQLLLLLLLLRRLLLRLLRPLIRLPLLHVFDLKALLEGLMPPMLLLLVHTSE